MWAMYIVVRERERERESGRNWLNTCVCVCMCVCVHVHACVRACTFRIHVNIGNTGINWLQWLIDYNFLITGVFHNLLPGLPNTVQSQTFRGVLSFLSSVLDIDVLALVSTTKPVRRHQGTATSRDTEPSDSTSVSTVHTAKKFCWTKISPNPLHCMW